jgi:hypothetical protein
MRTCHELNSSVDIILERHTMVYPKVSGLAAGSENCKWYSSLTLGAVVSLFVCAAITFCVASQRVFVSVVYFVIDPVRKLLETSSYAKCWLYLDVDG